MPSTQRNNRILIIDDNPAIHTDMRKILCPPVSATASSLAALEAELLGDGTAAPAAPGVHFIVDDAHQGREGLALLKQSLVENRPYAMAFVDMRMPPGWDGLETTLELWKVAPDLQIVICTAYTDYSWDELLARIGDTDRLVILKKPFDTVEVLQLANALTTKWTLQQEARAQAAELESRVRARTAELEASNAALQEEIARRKVIEADLVRARDAAEAAARAKSAFLANMSHEVRTPMNGVIGMANLLLNGPLNAEQRDLAYTLCQSGEALLAIINDILDFSKVEAGRVTLEHIDFDLAEELAFALDLHGESAARKGLELILDLDPAVPRVIQGDPVRLRQVLLNLIANAVKFTPQGEVIVRIARQAGTDGRVRLRFEVVDTGVGIDPEVLPLLFQPFVQADSSTTRRFGGTGLGLAICKRLVELMGGEIGVSSEHGGGSTFWFEIAFDVSTAGTAGPDETACTVSLVGRRVLVVDDNATNRKLLSHLLTAWQIEHRAVDSAAAAMTELHRAARAGAAYEMVLLDHHMPGCDGLGLAAQIRADASVGRPALVLLTSRGERMTAAERRAHGLAYCELKPFHPDKLRTALARTLGSAPAPGEPEPAASVARTPSDGGSRHPGSRILVAEDNRVNQKVALLQLRTLGYDADVVGNGREALAALARKRYALVLMDAQMPELDGFEATRIIRRAQAAGDPAYPPILPIIAMTANAMAGDREACIAAGMDDYISKPVNLDNLRQVLARHLIPIEPAATA